MRSLFSDEQNRRDVFLLQEVIIPTGAATPVRYNFRVPRACVIEAVEASAQAASTADNYTAAVRRGTTPIIVTAAVNGNDVLVRKTTPESGQSLSVDAGEVLNVFLTYTGIAANIQGIVVKVWAYRQ